MKIWMPLLALLLALSGCSPRAGTYYATARLIPGHEGSNDPGYTLEDIQGKVSGGKRSLVLEGNGRYTWNTGSAVNEGRWRIESGKLYLRDDIANGVTLSEAMQLDRVWRADPDGSMVNDGSYSHYGVEVVYAKP